jgi:hypothetical protein
MWSLFSWGGGYLRAAQRKARLTRFAALYNIDIQPHQQRALSVKHQVREPPALENVYLPLFGQVRPEAEDAGSTQSHM